MNQVGLWSRCAGVCLLGMLNLTRGTFWFVHKPVFAWTILHRAWDHCEPPAEASWEPTETPFDRAMARADVPATKHLHIDLDAQRDQLEHR